MMKYNKKVIIEKTEQIRKERYTLYKKDPLNNKKYSCCRNQMDFAAKIGVSRKTYSNWKSLKCYPSLENMLDICNILDCNLYYFIGDDKLAYPEALSKLAKQTNIHPNIIVEATQNLDYRDFLNYFMQPDNFAQLFNKIKISEWKQYLLNNKLSEIKPSLLIKIQKAFNEFYLTESPEKLNIEIFKEYIMKFIPKDKVIFSNFEKYKNYICVIDCFSTPQYKDFKSKCPSKNKYEFFIDYLAKLTFTSLINSIYLEIQLNRISNSFMDLINKYFQDFELTEWDKFT